MTTYIALLRAINVGKRQVPMKALKALIEDIGFTDVQTYIASGNVIFAGAGSPKEVEAKLGTAISDCFGFQLEIILRKAAQWPAVLRSNPFPEETRREPNRVFLFLSKSPLRKDAAADLMQRAQHGERVKAVDGILWLHCPHGIGASKISATHIDKACGSPTTGRNIRTAAKLAELAGAAT